MIEVSVIILNYKEALLTTTCIKSLLQSKKVKFEIIVIDNSCLKKEAQILKKIKDRRVKVHIAEKNLGCAVGYNFGIQGAKGKYVFILNNDTELKDKNALHKMKLFMDSNQKIGAIQPKIKSLQKPEYFEYAGAAGGYIDYLGYPFCRGRIFNNIEKDRGQYSEVADITWASTCAFFARRNLITKIGLFDPIYFAYAEEIDLSLKIWGSGYKILYFPDTEVFHRGETSWKKIRGKKTYLIHRNHLILYFKCLPLKDIILFLPLRILFELLSMINYIINNSSFHILAVILANLHVLLLLPKIIIKRNAFFKDYKTNKAPVFMRSIVIDYFLMRKIHFNMLNQKYFTKI